MRPCEIATRRPAALLSEAFASASTTPARLFGETDRGVIAEDMRADLIAIDADLSMSMTIDGEITFASVPTAQQTR